MEKYTACPFTLGCDNLIPKVVVCAGRSIPEHKGLLFRAVRTFFFHICHYVPHHFVVVQPVQGI